MRHEMEAVFMVVTMGDLDRRAGRAAHLRPRLLAYPKQ
jgi:hypothetical protein